MRPAPRPPLEAKVPLGGFEPPAGLLLSALAALSVLVVACRAPADDTSDLVGDRVEVVAVWEDAEADAFRAVLDGFEEATGATAAYTSTAGEDITAVLDRRVQEGDPPDVAVLPQPGLLQRYARSGTILPIDAVIGEQVRGDWAPVWRRLGSVDDRLYGLWFKAANKSLVWYSIGRFEEVGVVPPDDLDGLGAVADRFVDAGIPAFSLPAAPTDAWVLTDWFENLYLQIAGPDRYDALAEHRLPWTDPSVGETLRTMADLLSPARVVRVMGADTSFPESVGAVLSTDPSAAMVMEGDFVPGVVAGSTTARVEVDADVFAFPGRSSGIRYVVGAGDAAVLMRPTDGGEALLRYLASPEAAEVWAARGGFVSPNEDVDLSVYPTATSRRIARSLLQAGDEFRFDLSDLQPVAFGGTTGAGLWSELSAFLDHPDDVDGTMARLEAAAREAWGEG